MKRIKLFSIYLFLSFNFVFQSIAISNMGKFPIDVVIPAHEKDLPVLEMAIEGIKKYGKNVRRIIVVSARKFTDNAEWFNESVYPFSKNDVLEWIIDDVLHDHTTNVPRLGWIYQQFLKLYANIVIPNISPNILALDADTIFLNHVEFIDNDGNALYNVGAEYHKPYFKHMSELIKDHPITKAFPKFSGICHHMLFQKSVLEALFDSIYKTHNMEPWKAILHCIDKNCLPYSCFSEYEIYFNFIFSRINGVKIRYLKWKNLPFDINRIKEAQKNGFHYVSCHTYIK